MFDRRRKAMAWTCGGGSTASANRTASVVANLQLFKRAMQPVQQPIEGLRPAMESWERADETLSDLVCR